MREKRGLQLHLLSALGEIWRGGGLPVEGGVKKEVVGLSVVMKAEGRGEQLIGRRQLQDSGEYCVITIWRGIFFCGLTLEKNRRVPREREQA